MFEIWLAIGCVLTAVLMGLEARRYNEEHADDDDVIESTYKMTSTKEQLIQRRKALEPKEDD